MARGRVQLLDIISFWEGNKQAYHKSGRYQIVVMGEGALSASSFVGDALRLQACLLKEASPPLTVRAANSGGTPVRDGAGTGFYKFIKSA
jgi:hypothetical protein